MAAERRPGGRRRNRCLNLSASQQLQRKIPLIELREGEDVACRVTDPDFARSIERLAFGHDNLRAFCGVYQLVEAVDFNVKKCRPFAILLRQEIAVFLDTREALIHDLNASSLQRGKTELVTFWNLDRFVETEPLDPKRHTGFNVFHQQYRGNLFDRHTSLLCKLFL